MFTVTVEPDGVLAMIDGRDEAEVLVDPNQLPPVRHPESNNERPLAIR